MVNADGSNAHPVLTYPEGRGFFRLSPDGTKVYFAFNWYLDYGGQRYNPGLFVINVDGTGLHQILDRAQVHALFGKPVPELQFYWHGLPFDMSDDGSRIVLQVLVPDVGWPIMRVNGDGSGLQAYALFTNNAHPDVANLGISGDGRVAFYEVTTDPWELGVFNWDGSAPARARHRPGWGEHRGRGGAVDVRRLEAELWVTAPPLQHRWQRCAATGGDQDPP